MSGLILVTGATGYIGSRLVTRLLAAGHQVRCLVRNPDRLVDEVRAQVSVAVGSVGSHRDMMVALAGVSEAYYLVHAMHDEADFRRRDQDQATIFATACKAAGVRRIIYLGGLGRPDDPYISPHLQSRHEVGAALAGAGVSVLEFRAAIIIGSGSASFEMLRYLTERLPVMITPRWVRTRCQPIGVADVLQYLCQAQNHPEVAGIIDIGGPDVLSYRDMMLTYARTRGLRRVIIPVPVLSPSLSSRWVDFVTPIPRGIARPLIAGLRTEVVCRDQRAEEIFQVHPESFQAVLDRALRRIADDAVESLWCSSFSSLAEQAEQDSSEHFSSIEGMLIERHVREVKAPIEQVFATCASLGGDQGWAAGNALWRLRGWIDRLLGGVGMRRGRRSPTKLSVGETVDWWRVEAITAPTLLRLRAEMKLPGRGWLQFRLKDNGDRTTLELCAFFAPHGLSGLLYWFATKPFHMWLFPAMVARLAQRSTSINKGE